MKNIYKSAIALFCGIALFSSCQDEAKPLASTVELNKSELVFEAQNVAPVVINVTADGDWISVAPKWLKVEPSTGSGNMQVKVTAMDNVDQWNEVSGPRSGVLNFCYGTAGILQVPVLQKGENGLDTSREFVKISKDEDMTEGAYLIVFNDGKKLNALKPFSADNESYYSYLNADEVTADAKDVIATPDGVNAFMFEKADKGYYLKMSNGRYLFQSSSYNNFYSTTDVSKANVWSVKFNEEGFAVISNESLRPASGEGEQQKPTKYLQFTSKYGNAGAYDVEQEGFLPCLYKDSEPASGEILVVPETYAVVAEAQNASIKVKSNKTWKVRCHDEWIKTFTKSGEGDGQIDLTFDVNESKTEARTATIHIIGETVNFKINFVQNMVATTIAQVSEVITSTDRNNQSPYSVELSADAPAVVSYVNGKNAYIEDKTGALYVYSSTPLTFTPGQKLSGKITGSGYIYNNLPQVTSVEGASVAEGTEIPCTEVTLDELLKNYDKYLSRRILIKGVTVTDPIAPDDRDGKIESDGKSIAVRAQTKTLNLAEGKCDLICFPAVFKNNKQLAFWQDDHCTPVK